jgi:TRAP-type C4-dicarboxylate transport system permease small subunit
MWIREIFVRVVLAQSRGVACGPDAASQTLCNPLALLQVNDFRSFLTRILNDIGGLIGLLAIAVVVWAGFRLVTANGEKAAIDSGKRALTYAIYGFVASVMAFTAVAAIVNFLGVKTLESPGSDVIPPLAQFSNLKEFLSYLVGRVLVIIGLVSLLMIIVNGYKYMTASGNQSQVDSAKLGLTWAVGGLMLSLLAFTLIFALNRLISR